MGATGTHCSCTHVASATFQMTNLASVRVLQRTGPEIPFSGPLVTVLFLPELVCSLGMQAAHLAVTQQQITICTARCWALPLPLGAKDLHGVGTN